MRSFGMPPSIGDYRESYCEIMNQLAESLADILEPVDNW